MAANRYYRVVTKDGQTVTGRLLNEDTFSIQMIDTSEKLRSFKIADLREHAFVTQSPMPSYKDKLTRRGNGRPGRLPDFVERTLKPRMNIRLPILPLAASTLPAQVSFDRLLHADKSRRTG